MSSTNTSSTVALRKRLKQVSTIFFDYDGCLHDSLNIYAPAFRKAQEYLIGSGFAENRFWPDYEIRPWIGLTAREMWQRFLPDLAENIKKTASGIIGEHMLAIVESSARLYPHTIDTLETLKKRGLVLILISNCSEAYLNAHNKAFKLDRYFDKMISAEVWQYASKTVILSRIMNLYPVDHAIIGDREIDIEAGRLNNMVTIGARYGYAKSLSEFAKADIMIDRIEVLTQLF